MPARVLERRIRPDSRTLGFRRNNAVFVLVVEHWTSFYVSLHRVLEGLWEFAQPVYMCFVDLEKAFDCVPRGILVGGCSTRSMGSGAFAKGCSVSVRPEQELGSHCRQTVECEASGMRIGISKSEAMDLDQKRVACPLRSCMPRSLTLSSTSLVPEESFPPPVATKAPADTQSTAADHLQPRTNSQAPQPVRSDPSRAPKWLELPGGFDEGRHGACWKHLLLHRGAQTSKLLFCRCVLLRGLLIPNCPQKMSI
ncbi:hypothetical protein L3Q82_002734 [Scortum barcoo]|uniref:Uncharacterized protein n=1 Tax=Scortum barcoo TaxID=214431 RepID=A0ACB8VUI2_9TELE|nr:hypothetical protein L3Q82_002734 [Scortum barcoo]